MRAFSHNGRLSRIFLTALLSVGIFSNCLQADDKESSNPRPKSAPPKSDASKVEAPAPLTERERWMLDRIEQLEKRVAELESKNNSPAAAAAAAPSPQPSSLDPIASAAVAAAKLAPTGTGAITNVIPAEKVLAAVSPQATEKGKAGVPKSPAAEPFAFADFTWLTGNARTKESPMDTTFFTPEIRADIDYIYDFNHPKDNSIGGSSEVFRVNEVQVTQLGVGGDFHYDNVRARLMTQFGLYSQTTPRNDASPARGQWNLDNAYRYISEAYGGYHFNALYGINVDAGIFMSYVGLFSYYQFDNWAYQPSYVSSNTPWFFNGVRVQIFPTEHLKIEPWFVNGWQSYGRFNNRPGFGVQFLWRPNGWLSVLGNQYMLGTDTLNTPGRVRYHTDDSIQIKYYDNQEHFLSKAAFSLTGDMGCEHSGGVSCAGNSAKGPKQSFLGYMVYNRLWFDRDKYALTLGGGQINNPGRYLVLIPPINGATAASGTPYFTANPGDPYKAWDVSGTFDWMPSQYITFRWEYNHRAANVPYFSGSGGVTPPGGNNGASGSFVCLSGFTTCNGSPTNTWFPDLRKTENRLNMAILVKF
ncbi:MAG TPA: outer membrane beta-barrel protein [Candidatus Elarobacter sp.]|nr:outer membrane beta-barrel protein [Candidatus Elarobacter sp.]